MCVWRPLSTTIGPMEWFVCVWRTYPALIGWCERLVVGYVHPLHRSTVERPVSTLRGSFDGRYVRVLHVGLSRGGSDGRGNSIGVRFVPRPC